MSITIQITQNVINALSGETIITPEKIVKQIGQIYDKDSNYIFEIKENITIPTGKTLKDFNNIVVNPETSSSIIINNKGTIENCTITLNSNPDGQHVRYSRINNGYFDNGNIIGCSITINKDCYFFNGEGSEGNINICTIILNDGYFTNGYDGGNGSITGGNITLNGSTEFYNRDGSIITGGNIILSNSSNFYNGHFILNSYIFLHNKSIFKNFINEYGNVTYGTLTDTYIFAFDTCQIMNSYNGASGTFDSTILKFSDNCTIDGEIDDEKTIDTKNIVFMSTTEIKKLEDNNKNLSDTNTRLEAENEILNNQICELKTEIKNTNGNTNYVKDDTLSKLLLLSYLTQKDNSSVLQNLIK